MKYRFETFSDKSPSELAQLVTADVAIVAASWENRSKTALSVLENVDLKRLIVVRFSNAGKTGVSGNIRHQYKAFCKERKIEHREIVFNSVTDDYGSLVEVSKEIDAAIGNAKRLILDITSAPRLLWCSLVALWDKKNFVRTITFLYARPNYAFKETPDRKLVFDYTDGDWQLTEPAFLPPVFKGGLAKTNFISIGYEYDQIKKFLYRFEADNNVFVYSSPGFREKYTELALETVGKIKNVFEVPESKFMPYPVQDFIGLQRALSSRISAVSDLPGASVLLVCAGSKIHSLAFLFCALENPTVGLRVRVPQRYNEVSTEWTAGIEAITAENIFSPL